jgi:hypothetical protein
LSDTEDYFFVVTAYDTAGLESDYPDEVSTNSRSVNQVPIADAGPDQTVDEGVTVTLSGLNSTDPDDGIASYNWEQTSGGSVVLLGPWAPETTFTAPDVATEGEALSFQLTIADNGSLRSSDRCLVNVT